MKIITCATLILLIVPSGCSMRKTAILFADTIILFQFDKIFDLTDRQEEYLKKKIDDWLNWIKLKKERH